MYIYICSQTGRAVGREAQRLNISVQWFRGGLAFKAAPFCLTKNPRPQPQKTACSPFVDDTVRQNYMSWSTGGPSALHKYLRPQIILSPIPVAKLHMICSRTISFANTQIS